MKTYKEIYKFPLSQHEIEDYVSYRVTDVDNQFVFQFTFGDTNKQKLILKAINDESYLSNKELSFYHQDGYIFTNTNQKVILIRGWGNLTGTGGHNLSGKEAANVQDTLADFIVKQLNKRI